jgi:CheY-like chemotaxis protein
MEFAAQASARQLLRASTEAIVELLGEHGSCVLVDGGARVVLATHAPDLDNLPVALDRYPEIKAALESGGVVFVDDVHADPLMAAVRDLLPKRLGSVAVVPLLVGEHRMGVLMAQSTAKRAASAEALATAALIGRFTALVLEARLGKRMDLVFTGTLEAFPAFETGPVPIEHHPAATNGRRRLLIVEADHEHARTLAAGLRHGGYDVDLAIDGAEGLRRAHDHVPDAILMDVCLPVLDGVSTAERLREDPRTSAVPILFLSGLDELLPRARRATFERVAFVSRTEALPSLLARVEQLVRG